MSTVKVTNLQHPSSGSPNLVLNADGSVTGIGLVAVKHALFTGTQTNSTAAGANFAVTDLAITHALADASNKLIIMAYLGAAGNSEGYGNVGIAVADDGTLVAIGDAVGGRGQVGAGARPSSGSATYVAVVPSQSFVYEPGDTSAHTYTVRAVNISSSTRTVYINRTARDTANVDDARATSGLVIQEVSV